MKSSTLVRGFQQMQDQESQKNRSAKLEATALQEEAPRPAASGGSQSPVVEEPKKDSGSQEERFQKHLLCVTNASLFGRSGAAARILASRTSSEAVVTLSNTYGTASFAQWIWDECKK